MDIEKQNVDESHERDKETAVSFDDALAQAGNDIFNEKIWEIWDNFLPIVNSNDRLTYENLVRLISSLLHSFTH